jgi:hypothetical protein
MKLFSFVSLVIFLASGVIFADNTTGLQESQKYLKKQGLVIPSVTPKEKILAAAKKEMQAQKDSVLAQLDKMAEDQIITGKEINELKKKIKGFEQTRENWKKPLEVFDESFDINLEAKIKAIPVVYYSSNHYFHSGDNGKEEIRSFFIKEYGKNFLVKIQKGACSFLHIFFSLLFALVIMIISGLFFETVVMKKGDSGTLPGAIIGLIGGVLFFLLV